MEHTSSLARYVWGRVASVAFLPPIFGVSEPPPRSPNELVVKWYGFFREGGGPNLTKRIPTYLGQRNLLPCSRREPPSNAYPVFGSTSKQLGASVQRCGVCLAD